MKLKRVSFTSTSWDRPRNIAALGGNQSNIYVGQLVHHTARAETAKVASLEFDGRNRQLMMRLIYADTVGPNVGKPFRRYTVNESVQPGEECDVVGMFCDDRTVFYYDDEPAAKPALPGEECQVQNFTGGQGQNLPQCSTCGKDSEGKPMCKACYEAIKAGKQNGQPNRGK